MENLQSYEEIKAAYPNEWVLLTRVQRNDQRQILAAQLIGHHPNPNILLQKEANNPYKETAMYYTGKFDNMSYVLTVR